MEVRINKEIRDYTENMFFGLSLRQFIFSLLACITAIFLYFSFRDRLNLELLSWVCMLGAVPFGVLGFLTYNGMPAEKLIWAILKSEILTPKKLKIETNNIYYNLYNAKEKKNNENIKKNKKTRKR